ncbi:hypothetical protein AQUCO_02100170v1 [Aquilegia coerulea]|uniref:Rho termination factor-like N-terminal domain-containing protein n=1 Tax=Aquilegia coerulea TaxID=218851 RepID=A0A2G5DF57_AQUCA|nr:hypothetical protein AQUCO_02100170v1 [Aquilegia coerulea]
MNATGLGFLSFPSQGLSSFTTHFSKSSNLGLSFIFPRKEITDNAPCLTFRPVRPTVWSIRCEGNRIGRRRRSTASEGIQKGNIPESSDSESSKSAGQEDIIALFRQIQFSIAKDGGSTKIRKRRSNNHKERKTAESVLDVLRQSRKQIQEENKVVPKRHGVPNTKGETKDSSLPTDFMLTRPPSKFVKKSPIRRPSTLEEDVDEVVSEESEAAIVSEEPQLHKIEEMKVSELKELAKSRGIKGYSKLKKGELVELLKG